MKITRTVPLLAVAAGAAVFASGIAAAGSANNASLVIHHQLHGCHAWSLNGGPYKPTQSMALARGASLTVTNNDVMPHKLVELSGPAVRYTRLSNGMSGKYMGLRGTFPAPMLARMGASTTITFTKPGVYHFTTKPGEDFMTGMKTIGADNVLRLTVRIG